MDKRFIGLGILIGSLSLCGQSIAELSISSNNNLNFGLVLPNDPGTATVAINRDSSQVTILPVDDYVSAGSPSAGNFTISDSAGSEAAGNTVHVSIGNGTLSANGQQISLSQSNYVTNLSASTTPTVCSANSYCGDAVLDANGSFILKLGATADIGAEDTAGTYTGDLTVTMN